MTRLHDHLAEAIKDPDPIRVRARGDHPGDDLICLRFETMKVYSALGAVQAPVENREGAPRGYADRQLERDLRPCFGPGVPPVRDEVPHRRVDDGRPDAADPARDPRRDDRAGAVIEQPAATRTSGYGGSRRSCAPIRRTTGCSSTT